MSAGAGRLNSLGNRVGQLKNIVKYISRLLDPDPPYPKFGFPATWPIAGKVLCGMDGIANIHALMTGSLP